MRPTVGCRREQFGILISGWIHAESLEAVNGQPPGSWNFKRDLVVLWNLRWNPFSRQHPIRCCVRYLCRWGPYDPSQLFIAPNRIGDSRIGTTIPNHPANLDGRLCAHSVLVETGQQMLFTTADMKGFESNHNFLPGGKYRAMAT
uniref:Uncharacterized protein n=1 Tax=Coccidioides posadasii RMSCC 3488 TaxID=454284 RepID=A0A0J6F2I2_COCPO|nr:hypothetical protein CPAG_00665 [Coccidioides posadasii RMSCC 3488]